MAAPIPHDEADRLAALHACEVLDTVAEPSFDRITALAKQLSGAPIALVSLVDSKRQWFKSIVGLNVTETPRDHAFCAHAIFDNATLWIADATKDERFAANPLVIGAPHIRFYAGAPIVLKTGERIGTVCVIDRQPRAHDQILDDQLRMLAAMASDLMELRRTIAARNAARMQSAIASRRVYDGMEAMADGIVMYDPDDRLVVWNTRYIELFPHLAGNLYVGQHFSDIVKIASQTAQTDDDASTPGWVENRLITQRQAGEPFLQRLQGRIIETTVRYTSDGGKIVTHHDITDAVKAQQQLAEHATTLEAERQKFRDLLETTTDWFWETDANFTLRNISDNFTASTKLPAELFVGKCLRELTPSDQHPQMGDEWRANLSAHRDLRNIYVKIGTLTQGQFYLRLSGRPVRDTAGNFVGYRGTATDITLGLARAHAVHQGQKLQALGTMAAGLAHEFNNILAIVLGYAESLRKELHHNESALPQIEQIAEAGRRGASLSRSLLSFGRSSKAQTRETLNARALIADLPDLLRPLLGPDFHMSVKAGDATLWLDTDRSLLIQSVVNLVVNARDAMPNGGAIAITLSREPQNSARIQRTGLCADRDYVAIQISDTGMGMNRDTMNRLFDPFFTTKKVGEGTGLGLSLVFSFLKDHGGQVDVDSTIGVGTTFVMLLPLAVAPVEALAKTPARPTNHDFTGLHVLLVDDEPQLLSLYKKMLTDLGLHVTAHTDIDAALAALDDDGERLEVLVTDVLMPQMSGIRLAELARSLRPQLQVLFVTGQPERETQTDQIPKHATVLRKPFSQDQLAATLATIVRPARAA